MTDIKEEEGRQVVEEIKSAGGDAIFIRHDVASEDDWQQAISTTLRTYSKLDVVVNNAGVGKTTNVEETTLEDWRFLMSINLDGVFLGTKYGIKAMKQSGKGGSIINMSSILGIVGEATAASYNASKGGVRIFTKSAALHCARSGYNIRVNSVHPGYILTPMVQIAMDGSGDAAAMQKGLEGLHPMGHLSAAGRHCIRCAVPSIGRVEVRHRHRVGDRRRLYGTVTGGTNPPPVDVTGYLEQGLCEHGRRSSEKQRTSVSGATRR